jgi:16S rRNA processing protein RimM
LDVIGKITGTHGVKGLVVFEHQLTGKIDTASWDALMIELLPNSRIPFFISNIKKQSPSSFLIKFEEIDSPESAKEILQKNVFLSPNAITENAQVTQTADSYIGYTLFDKENKIGTIDNILNPKTNPLFIIFENKENELLIPANEELIRSVQHEEKNIIADLPEGLL